MKEKIIFIHGISNQTTGYSDWLYRETLARYGQMLSKQGYLPATVAARLAEFSQFEMLWADCTGPDVSKYMQTQYPDGRPGAWTGIERRVDPLVAQLGIYTRDKERGGPIVQRINELFRQALADSPDRITVIGHSLGSVIAWDYLFGWQDGFRLDKNVPVRALVTMGSPIPLFAAMMRHPVSDAALPANIGRWVNLIDPDDGVARFCRPHFSAIDRERMEDVEVSTGFWMISSHSGYWSSRSTAEAICIVQATPQCSVTNTSVPAHTE